jgi:hypothetical protein
MGCDSVAGYIAMSITGWGVFEVVVVEIDELMRKQDAG